MYTYFVDTTEISYTEWGRRRRSEPVSDAETASTSSAYYFCEEESIKVPDICGTDIMSTTTQAPQDSTTTTEVPPLDTTTTSTPTVEPVAEPTESPTAEMMFSVSPNLILNDTQTVAESIITSEGILDAFITDIEVYIRIDHTWIGDLSIELMHVDSGTTVDLYNFFCGCLEDNIDAYFKDSFDESACTACEPGCALCGDV